MVLPPLLPPGSQRPKGRGRCGLARGGKASKANNNNKRPCLHAPLTASEDVLQVTGGAGSGAVGGKRGTSTPSGDEEGEGAAEGDVICLDEDEGTPVCLDEDEDEGDALCLGGDEDEGGGEDSNDHAPDPVRRRALPPRTSPPLSGTKVGKPARKAVAVAAGVASGSSGGRGRKRRRASSVAVAAASWGAALEQAVAEAVAEYRLNPHQEEVMRHVASWLYHHMEGSNSSSSSGDQEAGDGAAPGQGQEQCVDGPDASGFAPLSKVRTQPRTLHIASHATPAHPTPHTPHFTPPHPAPNTQHTAHQATPPHLTPHTPHFTHPHPAPRTLHPTHCASGYTPPPAPRTGLQ